MLDSLKLCLVQNLRSDDNSWLAVDCVLSSLIEASVFDHGGDGVTLNAPMPQIDESVGDDHWLIVRKSDFDATYRSKTALLSSSVSMVQLIHVHPQVSQT